MRLEQDGLERSTHHEEGAVKIGWIHSHVDRCESSSMLMCMCRTTGRAPPAPPKSAAFPLFTLDSRRSRPSRSREFATSTDPCLRDHSGESLWMRERPRRRSPTVALKAEESPTWRTAPTRMCARGCRGRALVAG
jgi:hypothetical protein